MWQSWQGSGYNFMIMCILCSLLLSSFICLFKVPDFCCEGKCSELNWGWLLPLLRVGGPQSRMLLLLTWKRAEHDLLREPQLEVCGALSPECHSSGIRLCALLGVIQSRGRKNPLLHLAFFTLLPSFCCSDGTSVKCCTIYLQCCMYSLDVQNKVDIHWVCREKKVIRESIAEEALLLGCQLFSAEYGKANFSQVT